MSATAIKNLRAEIRELLAEPVASAEKREREEFGKLQRGTDGSVVLFGAGRLGRLCAQALRTAGVPLRAFCDRNATLYSQMVEGVEVMDSVEVARRFGPTALFVVAIWTGTAGENMSDRIRYLKERGCRSVTTFAPLLWAHGRDELPFHSFDLPSRVLERVREFEQLETLLSDENSLMTLQTMLRQRVLGQFGESHPLTDQYFPSDIVELRTDELVVDGGAFTGDTLEDFLKRTGGRFSRYYAFEPDKANVQQLRSRIEQLPPSARERIEVFDVALHSCRDRLVFRSDGKVTSRLAAEGLTPVQTIALDEILSETPVTFVKLDVEGAELDVLEGAKVLLTRFRPMAAICVYHGPNDIWRIPIRLSELMQKNILFLRSHGFDGWELVCYAIAPGRLIEK